LFIYVLHRLRRNSTHVEGLPALLPTT